MCLFISANKVLLEKLKELGFLQGDLEAMLAQGVASIFQPHGIGHFIGLDRHDVGGYLEGYPARPSSDNVALQKLRTSRKLEPGMFVAFDTGCYFIDALLDASLKDKKYKRFLVEDRIKQFRGFGGVRIKDTLFVDDLGAVNLTKVPRTVEHIEDWLAGIDYEDEPLLVRKASVKFSP